MYQMQSISVFLDIAKFTNFWCKNADANRTQEVCHVIYLFSRSSLGKVELKFHDKFHHFLHPLAALENPIMNSVERHQK